MTPASGISVRMGDALGLRWLGRHESEISRSLERLATGKRINRVSDDPAGLIRSEGLKVEEIQVLKQLDRIEQDRYRYAAIDGGLSVLADLFIDLEAVVVSAANTGGLDDGERKALQQEADSIISAANYVAATSRFKGELILQGLFGPQTGSTVITSEGEDGETELVSVGLMDITGVGRLNLIDGDLEAAQKVVKGAVEGIAGQRAAVGAVHLRLDAEAAVLMAQREGLAEEISRITDADFAMEVSNLVRSQVLKQAAQFAMMAARKTQADTVLALIGG